MRSSKSRSRNKSNRQRTLGNITNRVFESSGPEGKVRGTPQQIIEKYLTLARDAQLSHDRVAEQSFLQHAEHYTRMLGEANKEMADRQGQGRPEDDGYQSSMGGHGYHQGGNGQNGGQNGNQNHGHQSNGHSGQGGHQNDGGQRQDGNRDRSRDQQGRDNQPRDNQARDNQPRDPQGRDAQPRDAQPRDSQPRSSRSRREPRDNNDPRNAEAAAPPAQATLPDVLTSREDDAGAPVITPETGSAVEAPAKAPRARSPRARTPRVAADAAGDAAPADVAPAPTRSRRKPLVKSDAVVPDPQDGNQD